MVAIPKGLPLAITLGLSFAMGKMVRDNNYVRRLEACETMGSATQLNADMTGTLTQNHMTVVEGYWQNHQVRYDQNLGAGSYNPYTGRSSENNDIPRHLSRTSLCLDKVAGKYSADRDENVAATLRWGARNNGRALKIAAAVLMHRWSLGAVVGVDRGSVERAPQGATAISACFGGF